MIEGFGCETRESLDLPFDLATRPRAIVNR